MDSTFKYLNNQSGASEQSGANNQDAAQDFMNKKMAKNKYYDAGEGVKVGGDAYKGQMGVLNQEELDAWDAKSAGGSMEEMYEAEYGSNAMSDIKGAGGDANAANAVFDKIKALKSDDYWASTDLSSLMAKAGHKDHQVNIGSYIADGGAAVDASIAGGINFDSVQGIIDKKGWEGEKGNSIGQMGSALLAADGEEKKGERPEEILGEAEIEHSDEINEAKDRVKTYEENVLSGKTSEDIYGFDATKGAAGIGMSPISASAKASKEATKSFLDKKVTDTKDKYQFKAA